MLLELLSFLDILNHVFQKYKKCRREHDYLGAPKWTKISIAHLVYIYIELNDNISVPIVNIELNDEVSVPHSILMHLSLLIKNIIYNCL